MTLPHTFANGYGNPPDANKFNANFEYLDAVDEQLRGGNIIINGDMRIDQRNAGASVAADATAPFAVDRWRTLCITSSGHTQQRVADAPTGFLNSLKVTVGTGAAPASTEFNVIYQGVEGYNIQELGFGTSDAKYLTISFWVKSSITGVFCCSMQNGGGTRSRIATYTISAANTWEKKTVTFLADDTGTWSTDNTAGLYLQFDLGCGSAREASADVWNAGQYLRTSSAAKLIATSGATFQLTGVQMEVGENATQFHRRPNAIEDQLCKRYFQNGIVGAVGKSYSTTNIQVGYVLPVEMRSTPTVAHKSNYTAYDFGIAAPTITSTTLVTGTARGIVAELITSGVTSGVVIGVATEGVTLSAEL